MVAAFIITRLSEGYDTAFAFIRSVALRISHRPPLSGSKFTISAIAISVQRRIGNP